MYGNIFLLFSLVGNFNCGPGWTQQGELRQHTGENLFEYMNGNAEGYIIYGFTGMRGITCRREGTTAVVDISEMKDDESAYGLMLSNLDPSVKTEKLGIVAQVTPRRAIFVKGKFFAELAAEPEGDHTAWLREMAVRLEAELTGTTSPPASLAWFPEPRKSTRLVPQSVLGMRALERGYVVEYDQGTAFVVRAGDKAAEVLGKVRERFPTATDATVAEASFQAKDQYLGSLCIFRKGPFVAGFVKSPDAVIAGTQAAALAKRLP